MKSDSSKNIRKPTLAVILAGGRGERLAPLTDTVPKPMVAFHSKPFLEYLLEYLKGEGFKKAILLLGYLPEVVTEYFGDGSKFGIEIEYSITDVANETGPRLAAVRGRIDNDFLLMYCDNYCPLDTDKMWQHFVSKNTLAQIAVYANADKFTRNNLRLENGIVNIYDKSRTSENLAGVDIGFAFLRPEVLDMLPNENVNFEKVVYPKLVAERELAGFLTHHRYYSVGNLERLPVTDKFLKREPVVILDRDGVLNIKAPKGEYITKPEDFQWRPGSKEAILCLKRNGFTVVLVSNQAGIARGKMSSDDLEKIHAKMQDDLKVIGAQVDNIYVCPHGWDENCFCRKPRPGMLFQAQRELGFDLSRVFLSVMMSATLRRENLQVVKHVYSGTTSLYLMSCES